MNNKKRKQENNLNDLRTHNSNFEFSKKEPLFKGRISRNEFKWNFFTLITIGIVALIISGTNDLGLLFIVNLTLIVFTASLIVKRLHDLGRPSYHYFFFLIPIYNIIFILFELCEKKGQVGTNKYGDDPIKNI